jgi:hypothetical protein
MRDLETIGRRAAIGVSGVARLATFVAARRSLVHIDALLDERFVNHAARAYQSCVDCGGAAP